jgi:hypothetical protein
LIGVTELSDISNVLLIKSFSDVIQDYFDLSLTWVVMPYIYFI